MSAAPFHFHLSPDRLRFCPLCGHPLARQTIPPEGRNELVCAGCSFVYYLGQKVVGATIPMEDGRILLTRRAIHPSFGKWTYPGGYVDWGEPVHAAAIRETLEETGLTVELGGIVGVYSYEAAPVVIVVYEARVTGGPPRTRHEKHRGRGGEPPGIPWEGLGCPSAAPALPALPKRSPPPAA